MTATTQLQMPLLPTLDVFSGIVVTDPRVSSTDDFFGVESVRHILDFEARQFRTEAVAAGRVVGGHHRWLRMQTRPGQAAPPSPERVVGGGRVLPKPTGLVARGILRGVALDVSVPPVNVNRWAATEVHLSATPGFTPSASTLVASGRETHFEIMSGLAAGTTYYLRAFYVDVKGNKSLASDEVSAVAGRVGTDDIQDNAITDDSTVSETETSPITTTSTSYVEVPDMTLTVNLAVSARVLVLFQSNVNNDTDGRSVDTRLQIDGINYNESRFTSSTGNTTGNNMNMALVDLNAGSHTFKVFWRVSAGTGTMRTRQHFLMILSLRSRGESKVRESYACTKQNPITEQQTGLLDAHLKQICSKVSAISVVHYTRPQVVIIHCEDESLSEEELDALRAAVDDPLPDSS